uniref:Neuropeptide Y n=1 Tax=Magallana gigas TaxID=29159 RepID=A0A8W8ISD7_MAGGI
MQAIMLPSQICLLFIVTASWFCLNTASQLENMEMLAPPERPSSITNIDELRRYIKELNMYYLILARPRYGRSVSNKKPVRSQPQS